MTAATVHTLHTPQLPALPEPPEAVTTARLIAEAVETLADARYSSVDDVAQVIGHVYAALEALPDALFRVREYLGRESGAGRLDRTYGPREQALTAVDGCHHLAWQINRIREDLDDVEVRR